MLQQPGDELSGTGIFIQMSLLMGEAFLIAALTLFLFRLRRTLGLGPLYLTIGAFQYLQLILAPTLFVRLGLGLLINPAAILFIATLLALLMVYIWEDADETRKLIYSILLANISVGLLSILFGLHLDSPGSVNVLDFPRELFFQNLRLLAVGTTALLCDVFLIILIFEAISRQIPRFLFLRLYLSLALVLTFDSVFFVVGGFSDHPGFSSLLVSGVLTKTVMSAPFALALTLYLRFVERPGTGIDQQASSVADVFQILTYRQRFEEAKRLSYMDPLTRLFNRGYFDMVLPSELDRSRRHGRPSSLLLLDLDHFKQINDKHGHQTGDQALCLLASELRSCVRTSDVACRLGGDEFAVILPDADHDDAIRLSRRVRCGIKKHLHATDSPLGADELTVTIGIASFPSEASTAEDLVRLADQRLYVGKRRSRNTMIAAGGEVRSLSFQTSQHGSQV
ncbi:MAG: diguanylate cyclase [Acidobacteriota bacterium]